MKSGRGVAIAVALVLFGAAVAGYLWISRQSDKREGEATAPSTATSRGGGGSRERPTLVVTDGGATPNRSRTFQTMRNGEPSADPEAFDAGDTDVSEEAFQALGGARERLLDVARKCAAGKPKLTGDELAKLQYVVVFDGSSASVEEVTMTQRLTDEPLSRCMETSFEGTSWPSTFARGRYPVKDQFLVSELIAVR